MSLKKTGPGYAYIACDVCGRKIRQKDAILITDKYNTQYGLLVCKDDVDKTNPQAIPYSIRETNVQNPKLLRSEQTDTNVINERSDRVAGAPRMGSATLHPINDTIIIQWQGPIDNGSDPILYYKVYYSLPQDGFYFLLGNTDGAPTYFEDTFNPIDDYTAYRVTAVNSYGEGVASESIFFPKYRPLLPLGYVYLTTGDDLILIADDGYIIVRE